MRGWAKAAAVGAAVVLAGCGAASAKTQPTASVAPPQIGGTLPPISIVAVESYASSWVESGTGTVVAVNPAATSAWVATAKHVVRTPEVGVFIPGGGALLQAGRVVKDPDADLALIQVSGLGRRFASLGAVALGPVPAGAWGGDIPCVLWPAWTSQHFPFSPGPMLAASSVVEVMRTPSLAIIPGCSGAPLQLFAGGSDAAPATAGIVTGVADGGPEGVVFVPAAEVQRMLKVAEGD